MPSPVGHALAGVAVGWLVVRPAAIAGRDVRTSVVQALALGAAGALPDVDLVIGTHSGPTHGVGAALVFGLAVWAAVATRRHGGLDGRQGRGGRLALAMTLAYASHTLLDWMGSDTTAPIGIMALWPISREYFESDLHVFMAISRRHWMPGFWTHNLTAVVREVAILAPIAAAVWLARRRR